tara:strand:+ start:45 stop:617 length:573 start_codon:yes stop_codon:yes gene_type:complete
MKFIIIFCYLIISLNINASDFGSVTGLKLPRYVSTKFDDSNLRIGASKNYPIILKYINKNYPLMILEEYKDWRKILDFQDNKGWIHKSLIKGDRNGIINENNGISVKIYNIDNGDIIGEIIEGNIVKINKCKKNWCYISFKKHTGWINKKHIWGVDEKEVFNIGYMQKLFDLYWGSINFFKRYLKDYNIK